MALRSNSGVIVMGATNRPETLDQALMRPGRFDRHVFVDRPDVHGREAILKVHVKNVKLDPTWTSKKSPRSVPDLPVRNWPTWSTRPLCWPPERMLDGPDATLQRRCRTCDGRTGKETTCDERADEKQRVAYHEAGHALVAYSLPNTDPVHKVSIIPRGLAALGYTMQRPTDDRYLMTQSELESQLKILVAGTLAEELIYTDISTGASNDLERATDIARGDGDAVRNELAGTN